MQTRMDDADIVGVDIGGTKTHIVAMERSGDPREWVTPTADWRPVEQQRDPRALLSLIATGTRLTPGTIVGIGAHGCDTRSQCREFAQSLSEHSPATFQVVNDAELLVPAAGLSRGIGLVAGTGSIAVGEDRSGNLLSVGGWGWLLGDPGSGPALVRESAKQVLTAADAGEPPDELSRALCSAYDAHTPLELAYSLTASGSITHWGSRAPIVFDAARKGSTRAQTVLATQLDDLVDHVRLLLHRGARPDTVVLGGGVLAGQPEYATRLAARLTESTGLRTVLLQHDPVRGALTLAARLRAQTTKDTGSTHTEPAPHPPAADQGGTPS